LLDPTCLDALSVLVTDICNGDLADAEYSWGLDCCWQQG
jgi:hypothetical protein